MAVYKLSVAGQEGARIKATKKFMEENYAPDQYELEVIVKPPAATHAQDFTPEQLHESFTASEACTALKSSNPDVRAQAELLAMKRNKRINFEDAGYQAAIDDLEADGVLTADIAAEYRNGIPVDRM